jgi:hypothetical protein
MAYKNNKKEICQSNLEIVLELNKDLIESSKDERIK